MDTKFKILPVICCLALLAGCWDLFKTRGSIHKVGKAIPVNIRYPKPFKLKDTIWIKYSVGQNDMVHYNGYAEGTPIAEFTELTREDVSIRVNDIPNQGEYVNVTGDYAATRKMHYDYDTKRYEANYGFVPNQKGTCSIYVHSIELANKDWKRLWGFYTYIEGFDPKDTAHNKYLKIMVE